MARTLRQRAARILVEVVSVVFAVLVALAVDEWRQDRQVRHDAEAAKAAILAELRANDAELVRTGPSVDSLAARLAVLRERIRAGSRSTTGSLNVQLPDFSDAAWRTAQMTRATTHLDLAWLIRVAKAYEAQSLYTDLRNDVVHTFAGINGDESTSALTRLAGQLGVLQQLGAGLEAKYDTIFAPPADTTGGSP